MARAASMELQGTSGDSLDLPIEASLKTTYRALLARGLEAGEAANLTAFLHGLPSDNFHWTLPEVESILRRRLAHAAERSSVLRVPVRRGRPTIHDRRISGTGGTHLSDPLKP